MKDLRNATVTLDYNTLRELHENDHALEAIKRNIARATTVEEGGWIDDNTPAPTTLKIDMKALEPMLLKFCLWGNDNYEFVNPRECDVVFEYGEHSIVNKQVD